MFEIEMPCCGTPTLMDGSANSVDCETCGVVVEFELRTVEALPVAA